MRLAYNIPSCVIFQTTYKLFLGFISKLEQNNSFVLSLKMNIVHMWRPNTNWQTELASDETSQQISLL